LTDIPLPVLYPALDVSNAAPAAALDSNKNTRLLVSLNRFERKKNLELLIHAAAWMQTTQKEQATTSVIVPTIVIAGGYDVRNVENVEYRAELGRLATSLNVPIDFRLSISDAERQELLTTALAVVYTPRDEHFGIVPLESMYAGTAVVASKSGGPMETIRAGQTGLLCDADTPAAFGAALLELLQHSETAIQMGRNGQRHVQETFSPERLQQEWTRLTAETVRRGQQRQGNSGYRVVAPSTLLVMAEGLLMGLVCLFATIVLRWMCLLHHHQSILGGVRRVYQSMRGGDEL
jgi:alpha-1,3/alpha-1,6-mannosyltransferase